MTCATTGSTDCTIASCKVTLAPSAGAYDSMALMLEGTGCSGMPIGKVCMHEGIASSIMLESKICAFCTRA